VNEAAALFGESASRVIVSTPAGTLAEVLARAAARKVPARVIGQTGGNLLRMAVGGKSAVDVPVAEIERAWSSAIERRFTQKVA
jgi:phosphoribosylformylglycinamidine synthase